MTNINQNKSIGQQAVAAAKAEILKEKTAKAVEILKKLYRQKEAAQVALDNIDREIADAEEAIEQGNA